MPSAASTSEAPAHVYQILSWSPRPLKAKELADLLTYMLKRSFDRHEINVILYRLKKYGVVAQDGQFRWSVCATVTKEEVMSHFAPTIDSKEEKRIQELGPRPISHLIGHWNFTLGREPSSGREVWRMECIMCGAQVGHRVQPHESLLPLTGNLALRRRKHDRASHPELLKEQARAERLLLGKEK